MAKSLSTSMLSLVVFTIGLCATSIAWSQAIDTSRGCASSEDCFGATPVCVIDADGYGVCKQCSNNDATACTPDAPICGPGNTCISGCDKDSACKNYPAQPVCSSQGANKGKCVQCEGKKKTACGGVAPICSGKNTCIGCNKLPVALASVSDSLCSPLVCDQQSGRCVER